MAKVRKIIQQRMCVQMENYPNYITKVLYDEYQLGNSCDLVIKTGEEKHESFCHKMVLAFSSDFLRQVLSTITPGTTPVLLLPDIGTDIIDYIMVFMYSGQVKIPSEKYTDFVDACKVLQLKGMSWNEEEQEIFEDHVEESVEVEFDNNMESEENPAHFIDNSLEVDSEYSGNEIIDANEDMAPDYIEEESENVNVFDLSESIEGNHSKVRLKSEYIKSPFDTSKIFRLPKSTKEHQMIQFTPPINLRKEPHLRDPQQKISMNDNNITTIREKLITAILNVYKDLDMKLKDVQLVVKDNKLQKGVYQCSLCEKMISVVYTVDKKGKFRQWVNSNLKRHIVRTHYKEK